MQNVVAINAAARQGIIAAQATSDEALLESITEGGRHAILYEVRLGDRRRRRRQLLDPLPSPSGFN